MDRHDRKIDLVDIFFNEVNKVRLINKGKLGLVKPLCAKRIRAYKQLVLHCKLSSAKFSSSPMLKLNIALLELKE
jgi:hypothetical protein